MTHSRIIPKLVVRTVAGPDGAVEIEDAREAVGDWPDDGEPCELEPERSMRILMARRLSPLHSLQAAERVGLMIITDPRIALATMGVLHLIGPLSLWLVL